MKIGNILNRAAEKLSHLRNIPFDRYKVIVGVLSVMLLFQAVGIGKNVYTEVTADCIDWGLSFPEEGKAPVGNSEYDYLKEYDCYFYDKGKEKTIYLTFDAGYENGYTDDILDTLKSKGVNAAFFLVGHYVKTNPILVKRMVDEGHIIGNHTLDHPDMTALTKEKFVSQITSLEKLLTDSGYTANKFYRPPSGKYNEETLLWAKEMGYRTVLWSLAYADWDNDRQPTKETAFEKILPRLHDGCILLLHSTSKTNSEILGELIDRIKAEGYTFATLDKLE